MNQVSKQWRSQIILSLPMLHIIFTHPSPLLSSSLSLVFIMNQVSKQWRSQVILDDPVKATNKVPTDTDRLETSVVDRQPTSHS